MTTPTTPHPACFDGLGQYESWLSAREEAGEDIDYCNDCLPRRQLNMIVQGRCEYPDTEFSIRLIELVEPRLPDPEGELVGIR